MKPFEAFVNLSTDEFAEWFSSFLRVDTDNLSEYKPNLAFLVSIFFFQSECVSCMRLFYLFEAQVCENDTNKQRWHLQTI